MMGWPRMPLGEIFEIARGGSPRPIDAYITDSDDGINWISIADASESSKYIERTRRRIRSEGASRSRSVVPGDLLLTNSMSFGRPYIMRTTGCIHDGWLVLARKREGIDQDFFYRLLGSDAVYADFARLAAGATVKNLNIDLVKGVSVPVPPLPEQRRIAAILDQADALRAKRREALVQLESLTQSIFIEMFGDPIENPRRLPVRRLIDLVDGDRPITYGILMPGPDQETGVKYVRVVDMRNGGIDLSGVRSTTQAISNAYKRSLLRAGDLLMSIRGHVGRLALVPKELEGANITQDTARFAIAGADPVFVRECLRTPGFQRWMAKHTKGVAVRGINLGDVKQMPVIVPSTDVQQAFRRRAIAVDEIMAIHRTALAEADALFASLQHRAFAGQLS